MGSTGMNRTLAAALLFFTVSAAWPQYMTGVVSERRVVRPAEFSRASVVRIAEKFVQEHQDSSFARLMLFSDPEFGYRYGVKWYGPGSLRTSQRITFPFSLPTSFERWERLYSEGGSVLGGMAEILTRSGRAGVRIRYPDGTIERAVLRGEDPFTVIGNGQRCELLHYEFDNTGGRVPPGGPYHNITLYLRTESPLNKELGMAVTRQLEDFRPINGLGVYVRNDPWYIEQSLYPIVYGFEKDPVPPTREQYAASETMFCLWWQGRELTCHISRANPDPREPPLRPPPRKDTRPIIEAPPPSGP